MKQHGTWLAIGLSTCCACDGVGRALIDYQPRSASETLSCSAMRCEGVLPTLTVPDTPAVYGDVDSCRAPPDGAADTMFEGCNCQSLELDLPTDSALPFLVFGPGSFAHCRLHVRSEQPFELVWIASRLEDVHVVLEGPISMSLRSSNLARVSLAASSEFASLSFDRCNVSLFSLHDDTRPMPAMRASLTTFVNTLLETELTRLESVALRASTLTADQLDADDLNATHARLAVEQALIAASRMDQVELAKCRQLKIVGSQLSTVEATCSERVDLYSTRAQQSAFSGAIECDAAELVGANFGLSGPTTLLAYGSSFVNTSLCAQVRDARFQGGFGSCIDCEGPLKTGEALLCGEPTFATGGSENPCPQVAALQACVSFPDRARPQ